MKRKILIVEDNISLSQMQKDWFSQAGYDAVTAEVFIHMAIYLVTCRYFCLKFFSSSSSSLN